MERTGKSIKNIYFGLWLQLITTILSFLTRTILIRTIGIELLSLNGLFTEVISALSLAELGIGSSIAYSLYKPVAEKNEYKICQLMKLYKRAYHLIALVTLGVGISLTPWINHLITKVEIDLNYIRTVYVLFVVQLATSYLFSYKISLLNVDQKNYIYSKISALVKVIGTIIQIGIVCLTQNYILYLVMTIAISLTTNIICSIFVDRNYSFLKKKVDKLDEKEKKVVFKNVGNIFIKSVSGKITGSTDNILISTLVNTVLVGYYSNYNLILNLIRTLVFQIYSGVFNSVGNLMATESNERCEKVFLRLNYLIYNFAVIAATCVFTCMRPFIVAWIGDEYLLGTSVLVVCSVMLYIEILCKPLWLVMEVSGLFGIDKYAAIIGSGVNLVVSIVLGIKIGIIGIFIGTCLTYIIQMILKTYFLYRYRWEKRPIKYYRIWLTEFLAGIGLMVVCSFVCSRITLSNPIIQFIVNAMITIAIVLIVNVLATHKSDEFLYVVNLIKSRINSSGRR